MKKVIVGFGAALAVSVSLALDLTTPVDLASYPWTDAATDSPVYFKANSASDAFTLGDDLSLTGYSFYIPTATAFDFSSGNHSLSDLSAVMVTGGQNVKNLTFKGGKWIFKDGTTFRSCYWGSTRADNQRFIYDGVDMEMPGNSSYQGFYGCNNVMVMTNSAVFNYYSAQFLFNASNAEFTNNLLHVSGGSKMMASSSINIDSGSASDVLRNNRVVVVGEGSFFGLSKLGYAYLNVGNSSSGTELRFADGAYGYYGNTVIGAGSPAGYNKMIIENGAAYKNQQTFVLGGAAGANYNKLLVRNGGSLTNDNTNSIYVGRDGSFNELEVDNGSIPSCYFITCGTNPGAEHNVVRIKGDGYFIQNNSYEFLFGMGQYNRWVLDGATNTPIRTTQKNLLLRFVDDVNTGKTSNGTTNNTFEVVNGSVLTCYDLVVGRYCASNTVRLADSTVSVPHDLMIHGYYNDLVFSNATFKLSISGDNLSMGGPYFDSAKGESQAYQGDGNRLILQGQSRICRYDAAEYSSGKLYCNSTLRFEVPAEGYAEPIFQGVGLNLYYPFKIEVAGIEALQKNLKKSTKYQLTAVNSESGANNGNITFYDLPEGKTRQDILDEVNATLPKGCYLYTYNTNGLGLRVKANVGMMLIVR